MSISLKQVEKHWNLIGFSSPMQIGGLVNMFLSTTSQPSLVICMQRLITLIRFISWYFKPSMACSQSSLVVAASYHDAHAIARIHGNQICRGQPIWLAVLTTKCFMQIGTTATTSLASPETFCICLLI